MIEVKRTEEVDELMLVSDSNISVKVVSSVAEEVEVAVVKVCCTTCSVVSSSCLLTEVA